METAIEYNADCIRVLRPDEAEEMFEWNLIQGLANEYKCSPQWIARGFEACWRSGVDKEYFIQRYLEKNKTTAVIAVVGEAFRDLLHEKAGEMK
jgi:hypothetical protein